jgi:hypothetical protein
MQNQQGGPGGPRNSLDANRSGGWAGNLGNRWDGTLTGEEIRQMRSELRERIADAEALRAELQRQGVPVEDLAGVINGLRKLENESLKNRDEIDRMQQKIIEGLKGFEFGLRSKLAGETDKEKLYLSGSDQVPPAYRKIVEEYYRSLSSKKKN